MKLWLKNMMWLAIIAMMPLELTHAKNMESCDEGNELCTFVMMSEFTEKSSVKNVIINKSRANTPLSPFSTFKITNTIIALDTGIIKDAQHPLSYDQNKYPPQPWWPPVWKMEQYNLASAFKFSMVAIFRQLATNIGEQEMQKYLHQFNYGNLDISSGLDDFWLNGSMKISAVEQVNFLQKLYHNEFSLQQNTLAKLKGVMLTSATNEYKLYAKTGAGKIDDKSMLGWYVGFVENATGVHYFAFNFTSESYAKMKASRVKVVMNHLRQAGII